MQLVRMPGRLAVLMFLLSDVQCLLLPAPATRCRTVAPRMDLAERRAAVAKAEAEREGEKKSLGAMMFGTVAEGLKGLAEKAGVGGDEEGEAELDAPTGSAPKNAALERAVSDIDARAAKGEVTFRDFLTMSRTISGMDDSMGGALPPGLSASQLLELREKVTKHEKIVEVMLEDELDDAELLIEDLKSGGSTPGPRMQRLAKASGESETEVGLFLMQFEAMRESTRRIADGEDPDAVNESLSAPPGANRQARRVAEKKKAKAAKKKVKK